MITHKGNDELMNHISKENMDVNLKSKHDEKPCNCEPVGYTTPNLPEESRKFQTITSFFSDNTSSFYARPNKSGEDIGPGECGKLNLGNQIVCDAYNKKLDENLFVFYQLDNGYFAIANRETGEVLEHMYENDDKEEASIVFRPYTGEDSQVIKKTVSQVLPIFNLSVENGNKLIGLCNNNLDEKTKVTTRLSHVKGNETVFTHLEESEDIAIPSLPSTSELGPVPEVTGFNDPLPENDKAKRAIKGSVLIPSILVNDHLSLADRIKKNPYYTLEYRQYWHLVWSDLFTAGSNKIKTEVTGISNDAQEKMKLAVGMSVGTDLGLNFTEKSEPFMKQIISGLNGKESHTVDLGETTTITDVENPEDFTVRFARYARAHEFVLKDSDGKVAGGPWVVVDGNEMYLKRYKK
ncbi:hypothetical protein [Bacillus thuringiensis]|uniref:Insecticidal crystal toxin domain-containing protein n=1 Tax=Bacillus thuringiensis TaxID=1428 RepID=A0A9X6TI10_BACTU|nr:hypothetical protein [Bacillus thuringiensis]PEA86377.1 hypothetical protein CON71_30360 [Bacillus thuringiensis]